MTELPNNIEELLKLRIGVHKALIANVDLNAGKPEMVPTEQSLLKDRDSIDAKLTELGYVKPNIPKCSCIAEKRPCDIAADACNYTKVERLSIGCIQEPGINPVTLAPSQQAATEEPKKRKRKRRKRESHSRAARASRAADALTSLADELDNSAETLKGLADELATAKENEADPEDAATLEQDAPEGEEGEPVDMDKIREEIEEEVDRISGVYDNSFSTDEIQNLADEMRSWSDNVQGTNLENTEKMQTVSDTADTMENAASTLDGLSFPTLDGDEIQSFIDELEQLANDLRDAASDIEGCDFPGMYG